MQNTSTAVMQRRVEPPDALDDFPTQPWATRALLEHVIAPSVDGAAELRRQVAWEPACNRGSMVRPLAEYFAGVEASDIFDYGFAPSFQHDFLWARPEQIGQVDWIITNPPFRLAEQFIKRGLELSRVGTAVIVRTRLPRGRWTLARPLQHRPADDRRPVHRARADGEGAADRDRVDRDGLLLARLDQGPDAGALHVDPAMPEAAGAGGLIEWTEAQVEKLKTMWKEGDSSSEIARAIGNGCTRSAVMGKVHRLKLAPHSPPRQAAGRPQNAPRRIGPVAQRTQGTNAGLAFSIAQARKDKAAGAEVSLADIVVKEVAPVVTIVDDVPIKLRLDQLTTGTCRWPIGDPLEPDFGFCGDVVHPDGVYCRKHHRRAHQ